MILLALGIIIGLLLNPLKAKVVTQTEKIPAEWRAFMGMGGTAQFIENVSAKEKFDNAKNINDLLND